MLYSKEKNFTKRIKIPKTIKIILRKVDGMTMHYFCKEQK